MKTFLLGMLAAAIAVPFLLIQQSSAQTQTTTYYQYWLDSTGEVAFVTDRDYQAGNGYSLVWSKIENPSADRRTMIQEVYDCAGRRVAVAVLRDFKMTSGEVIRTLKSEAPLKELRPVKEFTREWVVFGGVCALFSPTAKPEMVDYFRNLDLEIRKFSK
jgi:hypothetical protein